MAEDAKTEAAKALTDALVRHGFGAIEPGDAFVWGPSDAFGTVIHVAPDGHVLVQMQSGVVGTLPLRDVVAGRERIRRFGAAS